AVPAAAGARGRVGGGGGGPRRPPPPGPGHPGAVRRRRRAGPGVRPRPGRRPAHRGARVMTAAPHAGPVAVPGPAGRRNVLELAAVTKVYPSSPPVTALRRVSVTGAAGALVAVLGPSGSGKSALLHLMGTLDRPTTGTVRVTGLDVAALADKDLAGLRATSIGFVFQQYFLAEHQSVLDNVADGL